MTRRQGLLLLAAVERMHGMQVLTGSETTNADIALVEGDAESLEQ